MSQTHDETPRDIDDQQVEGWDCEKVYEGSAFVYAFVTGDQRHVKIGFTRNGDAGVLRRLQDVRRKRSDPKMSLEAKVALPKCTEPDGWAFEEAMRLWLVHRRGFRWHPWQDFLVAPAEFTDWQQMLGEAHAAVNAWLMSDDTGNGPR